MILVTYRQGASASAPRIGFVDASHTTVTDLQERHTARTGQPSPHLNDMLSLIKGGEAALDLARSLQQGPADSAEVPLALVKLLSPVPVPEQIREFSVYEQHVRDAPIMSAKAKARFTGHPADPAMLDRPVPKIFFTQPAYYHCNRFNVIGPDEDVVWPTYSGHLDYELEIGAFIGRGGRNIRAADAGRHIFGYTIFNDISAREQMWREMDMRMGPSKGKSWDTANVIGPWIVTADEIPDVQALKVAVRINGQTRGSNTTANMLHSFEQMIEYISRDESLHPGEFFGSGTVGGCSGLEIDQWLQPGDLMELEVERIGTLRNRIAKPY